MLNILLFALIAPITHEVHPTHLLVKPRKNRAPAEIERVERASSAKLVKALPQIGWRILDVPADRLVEIRAALDASGDFEHVDFDKRKELAHVPNDPFWPGMWHMQKIRADVAWDTAKGGASTVVAVMDTGLDTTHPDIAANVWTNPGEIPGNGIDDDGNGYIDDVHGYDFAYVDSDPDDQFGHGTACAGIIAAVQDNNIGVTGVAPLCRVAGVKAANDSGYFYDSANVPALLYCADMGFKVISMSFYSDQVTPAERDAIDYCWAHGVIPVAAAGNDSRVLPYYPGAYEHVLCVAATSYDDSKSWFSNWGSWVDVAAPGEGISTILPGNNYTTGFAGTSGATPHVAGLAALLCAAVPSATNAQVRAAIEDSALTLVQPPYGQFSNYGRVDCADALARLLGTTSGSKPAKLLFVSPCAGGLTTLVTTTTTSARPPIDFYGIGLEQPNVVQVLRNGTPLSLADQSRNEVHVALSTNLPSLYDFKVNGSSIGSIQWDAGQGFAFAPSDANTSGGGNPLTTGGFNELYRNDGAKFTCTRRDDGTIVVNFAIRKVFAPSLSPMRVEFTRNYDDTNGVETIQLYDWSTWSFPYGNFVTVATTPISGTSTVSTTSIVAPNPARFVDDEGTMYMVLTTTGCGPSGKLNADCLRVRVD